MLGAGSQILKVTFTPTDTTHYTTATAQVALMVDQANPTINTWPTASSINYGQPLAYSILKQSGSASVSGTFAFTIPGAAPTAPAYGAQGVTFTA